MRSLIYDHRIRLQLKEPRAKWCNNKVEQQKKANKSTCHEPKGCVWRVEHTHAAICNNLTKSNFNYFDASLCTRLLTKGCATVGVGWDGSLWLSRSHRWSRNKKWNQLQQLGKTMFTMLVKVVLKKITSKSFHLTGCEQTTPLLHTTDTFRVWLALDRSTNIDHADARSIRPTGELPNFRSFPDVTVLFVSCQMTSIQLVRQLSSVQSWQKAKSSAGSERCANVESPPIINERTVFGVSSQVESISGLGDNLEYVQHLSNGFARQNSLILELFFIFCPRLIRWERHRGA